MKYPVYIPSRGRADTCTTPKVLADVGAPFYVVVEPRDTDAYRARFGAASVLTLPQSDGGLFYSRNWIKKRSRDRREGWHWQIDDNIRKFMDHAKHIVDPETGMIALEGVADGHENLGAVSMRHAMYAFAARKAFDVNHQATHCVLLNNAPEVWWRDSSQDDTDYSLQLLVEGWCTLVCNAFIVDKMAKKTVKGGLTDKYTTHRSRHEYSQKFARAWPGLFKVTPEGRIVCTSRIWSRFPQRPIRRIDTAAKKA